jgi:hypothetical protein
VAKVRLAIGTLQAGTWKSSCRVAHTYIFRVAMNEGRRRVLRLFDSHDSLGYDKEIELVDDSS